LSGTRLANAFERSSILLNTLEARLLDLKQVDPGSGMISDDEDGLAMNFRCVSFAN
jgi:hypothetical protein